MDDPVTWQRRLLPLMAGVLIVTALFFAAVSIMQFNTLQEWLERDPARISGVVWPETADAGPGFDQKMHVAINRGSFELEQQLIERRYGQETASVLARLWTRFMGFLTGMILAFVGAAFILGKLAGASTELKAGSAGWTGALSSSSPGLVLAVLGAILMVVSLSVTATTGGADNAVYFRYTGTVGTGSQMLATRSLPMTPAQVAAMARQGTK